jgi:aminotransferase
MTGWRIGYATATAPLMNAMRKLHQYLIMSAPTMSQMAAIEALTNGEDDVEHMRQEYDKRRRLIVDGFNRLGLPTFEPRGAFYCFPNVTSTGMSDEEFCEALLREERVAIIPGSAFGESGSGFVRASYTSSEDNIRKALDRIEHFMVKHGFLTPEVVLA